MHRTIPKVQGTRLYQSQTGADPIVVGTWAWYDWLEHHNSFVFVDGDGTFTASKSATTPNELDWEACRMSTDKRFRLWLGASGTLTLERLRAAAQALAEAQAPTEPPDALHMAATASKLPTPTTSAQLSPLMRTKLCRPRTSSDVIPRARLIERLNAGLSSSLTLLSAPAGFGKTTLLVALLETIDRHTAWLTLDETDNELAVFVHSLIAALHTVFPDACPATVSLLKAPQFPPPDRLAPLLINDLADLPTDVILVLDEYHTIHNSEVHSLLELLIRHLPPQMHLLLATRADPPLPLAIWRAQGLLNELRSSDLRFTHQETLAFLARVLGNDLARQAAGPLEERTEGWIALLRLAALSLRSASDPAAFMEHLRCQPDRSMSRYLVEEILSQQTPAVEQFLLQTSILDELCAELCAATIDRDAPAGHVQACLDWLESTDVFIVPLDEHQQWYRFHPLFKCLLKRRLQEHMSNEQIATLHRRASAWYSAQGLLEQAMQHALAAGDVSEAAQLVEARFLWAFEREQWVQMERWLRLLPEQQVQGSPSLLAARAWILQVRGQWAAIPPLLTAAEQLVGTSRCASSGSAAAQSRALCAVIALLWSMLQYFTGQAQASLESARSALEWIRPGEGYVANLALCYLALSNQATGHEDVALVELNNALREQSANRHDSICLLFAQALVYLAAGKLQQVEYTSRHFLRLTEEADLALSQSYAHWLLGVVYYEWNRLDVAVYHFSAVVANRHRAHHWTVREAMYGLALAYQAQGLVTQAAETARALLELVQGQNNMRDLLPAYAFQGWLALLQDEVESAQQWVEMAGGQHVLGPMTSFEVPAIIQAWMLLAKGDEASVAHGQAMLATLLQNVEAMHNTRETIQVLALQALAYDLRGCAVEALDVLERAIALAYPGGFTRTFADVPPLAKLLQELRKRRKTHQMIDRKLDVYLHHLLAAMRPIGSSAVSSKEELMRQEGLEPLTDRELQILRLLDKDLTNKEIARKLTVTSGTVKAHTNNLYRKLSVNNRRAAVTLSKALGLLAAD